MFIVLLNVVVVMAALGIAAFLTLVAIVMIIVSCVRASAAKKKGKKTLKVGLWVGIFMIVIPWILVGVLVLQVKVNDKAFHRWDVGKEVLATAVLDDDSDDLYDMIADNVLDRNGLTQDDLDAFLTECNIENDSAADLENYSDFHGQYSHYRPYSSHDNGRTQYCFQYTMYDVNDEGGNLTITGISGDEEDEDEIGIWYMTYLDDQTSIVFGEEAPSES